jgi:purine nucleosidase
MAGSYRSPGNTAPTSEWNVAVDPEAMQVVLRAFGDGSVPRPVALGLDVTERAKLTPEHLDRLAERVGCTADGTPVGGGPPNPVVRFLADALRFYMEFHSRYDGFYGAFIHDPLALASALDPTLVRTEAVPVDVELGGRLTTGETVADWRRSRGLPPNLDVAVEADIDRFFRRFEDRLADLATRRAGAPRARTPSDHRSGVAS